jgi:hypothetical protein
LTECDLLEIFIEDIDLSVVEIGGIEEMASAIAGEASLLSSLDVMYEGLKP